MICLDTYALFEIKNENPAYASIINEDFIIADLTLAEFYWVLSIHEDPTIAYSWYKKLKPFVVKGGMSEYIDAMDFRYTHKKIKFSFFDSIGYIIAQQNKCDFVTGDKGFKKIDGVRYLK